ncbi:MAG TPA: FkbM family methyltransferase [Bryobacteraceae bacterium]|nr:FkbM family methyltransferase [Bryobacteraceae bacterium]
MELLHAENHDIRTNGEAYLLTTLGAEAKAVADVGANRGLWTLEAARSCPNARIYSSEVVSETREELRANVAGQERVTVLDFGLADHSGTERVKYYPKRSAVSSFYDYPRGEPSIWRNERVETGDWFLEQFGIASVDLLKVDTEGADLRVLRGFEGALSKGAIAVVQFEYGFAAVLARTLLIDFYEFLGSKGYQIGKLHSNGVDFAPYELRNENFFGPNFVAVHRSRNEIAWRLRR